MNLENTWTCRNVLKGTQCAGYKEKCVVQWTEPEVEGRGIDLQYTTIHMQCSPLVFKILMDEAAEMLMEMIVKM